MKVKKQISYPNLLKKAQATFNAFIRLRDADCGCISCGARVTEAGHYYSAGHHTGLRFDEVNTNGQCTRCNCFLSGNLIYYRNGLIKKYGEQKVLLLDATATRERFKKWSRLELELLISIYQNKLKQAA